MVDGCSFDRFVFFIVVVAVVLVRLQQFVVKIWKAIMQHTLEIGFCWKVRSSLLRTLRHTTYVTYSKKWRLYSRETLYRFEKNVRGHFLNTNTIDSWNIEFRVGVPQKSPPNSKRPHTDVCQSSDYMQNPKPRGLIILFHDFGMSIQLK